MKEQVKVKAPKAKSPRKRVKAVKAKSVKVEPEVQKTITPEESEAQLNMHTAETILRQIKKQGSYNSSQRAFILQHSNYDKSIFDNLMRS